VATNQTASANEEAIGAWDGVLFDRFRKFRHIIVPALGAHGDEAMRLEPPATGDRVLDIGCGFGDTTLQLAGRVGAGGSALGVDAAPRFIEAAREEASEAGAQNVRFEVVDVEATSFDDQFDYAFSRFGTMFFANPVAALRNIREALVPGGRLCMVVWRQKLDNPWIHRAETVVEGMVAEEEDSDELTCGPGPFSMANADATSHVLLNAGFLDVTLRRCDIPIRIGRDLEEAAAYVMALGPAGEHIRLAGEEAQRRLPEITAAVREALSEYQGEDGVRAGMSTWIVSARSPAGPA